MSVFKSPSLTIGQPSIRFSETEFELFRQLIHERSGISLASEKLELVRARLLKRLHALGLETFIQYYRLLQDKGAQGTEEMTRMIDAITTNKTEFFRENGHFDFLKSSFFPKMRDQAQVRILSAGCSSGEEPYSIAISAAEHFGASAEKVQVFAGDLCTQVLAHARRGIYSQERLAGMPLERIHNHFLKGTGDLEGQVKVAPHIQKMVQFQPLNLMENFPYPFGFQAIFCRNVVIYFDRATQGELFRKFYEHLVPGGMLFIGHSESLVFFKHKFSYVQPSVYRKPS